MTYPQYPVEGIKATVTLYTLTLWFSAPGNAEPSGSLVMPLPVAKELAMILRKVLLETERSQGRSIELSEASYQAMGVAPEDWPHLE